MSAAVRWCRSTGLLLLFLCCYEAPIAGAIAQDRRGIRHPTGGYTFYVVPHSHMDLEWTWQYQRGEAFAIRILQQALKMMKQDSRFTFTQDQMLALKPFWDSLSEVDRAFLRRMVSEGRFEVTSGMFTHPDVNQPDFESLTRQLLLAKPWMQATLGAQVITGWNIDAMGQTVQIPQLFRRAGLRYAFFTRSMPPAVRESAGNLFYWLSPDGSRLLAHIGTYDLGGGLHPDWGANVGTPGVKELEYLIQHNPKGNDKIMIPWGDDEYLPTETSDQIESMLRGAARKIGIPVHAVLMSTPGRYFQDVERSRVALPTYTYDFNPPLYQGAGAIDLRGVWAERPTLKISERRSEEALESAEKLATIASRYGDPYPGRELNWGWERVLTNQNHDTVTGSHSDAVYQDALSRYGGALEMGRQVQEDALFRLSRGIDTSNDGDFPFVVFNTLSFARTDVVRAAPTFIQEMYLTNKKLKSFSILDPSGQPVPFRVVAPPTVNGFGDPVHGASTRHQEPAVMAMIEIAVAQVPALGYRAYRIVPAEGTLQTPQWQPVRGEIQSPHWRLRLDPATGSIVSLVDRLRSVDVLDVTHYGGNELVLEEEKDPSMEGALSFTGSEIRGSESRPDSMMALTDELGTTVRIEGPFLGGRRVQEISLYNAFPRIDFRTEIKDFPGHDGMLTVVFPLEHRYATTSYETHNAVTVRPDGIYDANSWVDLSDGKAGVTLINRGTGGHQIEAGTVKLLLLRSATHFGGYYSPDASEAGDHVFEYSLYPHSGDWHERDVVKQAHSANTPLKVISTDAHEGSLPSEFSYVSISSGDFEVTALKKAEQGDDLILRGHEIHGEADHVRLRVDLPVQRAWLADLLEQPGDELPIHERNIDFDCQPFEFVTLRLRMTP